MNISPITNTQTTTNNVNFKSKIVPTKFLGETLDYAIGKSCCQRPFLDALKKILNDGKNNVLKFDSAKGKLLQKILPGAFNTSVNGVKRPWNYYFGVRGKEAQCEFAVIDYAKGIEDCVLEETKVEKLKALHDKAWSEYIMHHSYDMNTKKAEKYMEKKVAYLKRQYNKAISEELTKIKKEIFAK